MDETASLLQDLSPEVRTAMLSLIAKHELLSFALHEQGSCGSGK